MVLKQVRNWTPAEGDPFQFAGGSYAKTYAQYRNGAWSVIKRCKRYSHKDKDLRLRAEIESISDLPVEAQKLFPRVLDFRETKSMLAYEIEYVPYQNFAEIVGSGDYTARKLSMLLENIYTQLFDVLYLPYETTNGVFEPIDYVQTSRARLQETLEKIPKNHRLRGLMEANSLVINGVKYPGLDATLRLAQHYLDGKQLPITYNHGDLILQDILVDPKTADFRLIDANGSSTSYINDFAKTLLCLRTKYDLLYNGDFSLKIKGGSTPSPQTDLLFTNEGHLKTLDAMELSFQKYLAKNQAKFFNSDSEWQKTLNIICGLQNIAIVMFHVLHHKKSKRACAFLVSGIALINDSMRV